MENKEVIDVDWLASNIQLILNKVHVEKNKLTIKQKHDRLTFACPICGDSQKNSSMKRGHLFFRDLHFKCHNEGCFSTFTQLCTKYNVALDPDKKLSVINWVSENAVIYRKNEDNILANEFKRAITMEQLQEWFDDGLGPLSAFKPVQRGSKVYNYLKSRGFYESQMAGIYEGIKNNGKWSEPYMVFLNTIGNKVLGLQERNLKSGDYRRFKIWTFSEIYEHMHKTKMDPIEAIPYNKISQLFNIFNVNYDKDITMFEAYIDSKFFPNSIGAVGLNTDMSFLINNELSIRFFFDNDNIGRRKAKEWLRKGYSVFLWEKFTEWYCNNTEGDYYTNYVWFENNIKDLNDLSYKIDKAPSTEDLLKFFSNNILDIIWITNDKKPIYKKDKKPPVIHDVDWNNKINELKL